MSNIIKLGNHNLSLIMYNGEVIKVFINEQDKAINYIEALNLHILENGSWITHTLENIQSYGLLKESKNKICVILKYDIPISVYLNSLYKAESEFSMLSKDIGCDYGVYQIIRDMVV